MKWILLFFSLVPVVLFSQVPSRAEDVRPKMVGEYVPDLVLKTSQARDIRLHDLLKKKPAVLIFYRGGWCPYCNHHLSELAGIEDSIQNLGYQVIAVSPDSPDNLVTTASKDKINYLLLSDPKGELVKAMGIAYQATFLYENFRSKGATGEKLDILPVPSVFVTDRKGKILFEYVNPDYRERISGKLLLSVLSGL
jgi:peroxiredoxin